MSKYEIIGADIGDYLTSIGFRFFRSDKVGFPDEPLSTKDLRMFKAFAQLYPYLQKHIPKES